MKTTKGNDFAKKLTAAGVMIWKWAPNYDYFYATKGDRHVLVMFVENGRFYDARKTDRYGHPIHGNHTDALRSMAAVERHLGI